MSDRMAALFAGGHPADLVLLVMTIQAVLLARFSRIGPLAIVAATLPGALIVGALRGALIGTAWPWIMLPLLLSWPAHLWDIRMRAHSLRR